MIRNSIILCLLFLSGKAFAAQIVATASRPDASVESRFYDTMQQFVLIYEEIAYFQKAPFDQLQEFGAALNLYIDSQNKEMHNEAEKLLSLLRLLSEIIRPIHPSAPTEAELAKIRNEQDEKSAQFLAALAADPKRAALVWHIVEWLHLDTALSSTLLAQWGHARTNPHEFVAPHLSTASLLRSAEPTFTVNGKIFTLRELAGAAYVGDLYTITTVLAQNESALAICGGRLLASAAAGWIDDKDATPELFMKLLMAGADPTVLFGGAPLNQYIALHAKTETETYKKSRYGSLKAMFDYCASQAGCVRVTLPDERAFTVNGNAYTLRGLCGAAYEGNLNLITSLLQDRSALRVCGGDLLAAAAARFIDDPDAPVGEVLVNLLQAGADRTVLVGASPLDQYIALHAKIETDPDKKIRYNSLNHIFNHQYQQQEEASVSGEPKFTVNDKAYSLRELCGAAYRGDLHLIMSLLEQDQSAVTVCGGDLLASAAARFIHDPDVPTIEVLVMLLEAGADSTVLFGVAPLDQYITRRAETEMDPDKKIRYRSLREIFNHHFPQETSSVAASESLSAAAAKPEPADSGVCALQ